MPLGPSRNRTDSLLPRLSPGTELQRTSGSRQDSPAPPSSRRFKKRRAQAMIEEISLVSAPDVGPTVGNRCNRATRRAPSRPLHTLIGAKTEKEMQWCNARSSYQTSRENKSRTDEAQRFGSLSWMHAKAARSSTSPTRKPRSLPARGGKSPGAVGVRKQRRYRHRRTTKNWLASALRPSTAPRKRHQTKHLVPCGPRSCTPGFPSPGLRTSVGSWPCCRHLVLPSTASHAVKQPSFDRCGSV
jgi:hypothetical protein